MLTKFMRVAIFVIVFFRSSEGEDKMRIVLCKDDSAVIKEATVNDDDMKGIVVIMLTNKPHNESHIEALLYFERLGVKKGIIAEMGRGVYSCTYTFAHLRTSTNPIKYPLFFVIRGGRLVEGSAEGDIPKKLSDLWASAAIRNPTYRYEGTLAEGILKVMTDKNASYTEAKQARYEMKVQGVEDEYQRAVIRNQRRIRIDDKPAEIQETGRKRSFNWDPSKNSADTSDTPSSGFRVPLMPETSTKRRPTMGALSSDYGREPEVYWPIAYNAYSGHPPIDWTKIQFPGGEGSSKYAQQGSPKPGSPKSGSLQQGSSQQRSPSQGSPPKPFYNF